MSVARAFGAAETRAFRAFTSDLRYKALPRKVKPPE
jgi:hypothetical protein